MYEIHIVTNKKYPKEGCRVDKETYEKYGIPVSLKRSEEEIDVSNDLTQVRYSGIEKILWRFCSFTYDINHHLKNPIEDTMPHHYTWTMTEDEIINAAAKHGIKIVFEDQLSLQTDFLNPDNALDVTLIDGYYNEEWNEYGYTVIPDYAAHKATQQAGNESYEYIRPENYDAGDRIHQALLALGGSTGYECWDITFRHAVDDELIKHAKTEYNLNLSVKDTNIIRNKFKIYFVKTDKPNVFRRIDKLGRVLLNRDIYYMEDYLSVKQCIYADKSHHEDLPSWKDVIGFTDDNGTVTIHKPIPEMIQTAKDMFDIDLLFVDKEPDIPYDPDVLIDVELSDMGSNIYFLTFGKYDMTDILAPCLPYTEDIRKRIETALSKYNIYKLDYNTEDECEDQFQANGYINGAMELTMKVDLQANFNIKFNIIRNPNN